MKRCQLRFLIPMLLMAAALVDVVARFWPSDSWTPSGFQGVNRWSQRDGRMEPNRRFSSGNTYGELALLGNRPDWLKARTEVFTTDTYGYRNPPGLAGKGVDVLLLGSSFSLGMGVRDEETLASRLQALSGFRIYNAALPFGALTLARIRHAARLLNLKEGVVLVEYLNRGSYLRRNFQQPLEESAIPGVDQAWTWVKGISKNPWRSMQRARFRQQLENDFLLPNSNASMAQERKLRNRAHMLFYAGDIDFFDHPDSIEPTLDALIWLREELHRDQLQLQVLLVPTSYTVYHPLLSGPSTPDRGGEYLSQLEHALEQRGVLIYSALNDMRAQAAAGLDRGNYLYWRDDGHWNPSGIDFVARNVAAWWQTIGRSGEHVARHTTGRM